MIPIIWITKSQQLEPTWYCHNVLFLSCQFLCKWMCVIVVFFRGLLGIVLTVIAVLWCSMSASKLFVSALSMDKQQLLVAYPCALVYGIFALLTVFWTLFHQSVLLSFSVFDFVYGKQCHGIVISNHTVINHVFLSRYLLHAVNSSKLRKVLFWRRQCVGFCLFVYEISREGGAAEWMCKIHTEDMFGPSLGWVWRWKSKAKVTRDKTAFLGPFGSLCAVFATTYLASSVNLFSTMHH